jgi:CheY-like chemotaxis protein
VQDTGPGISDEDQGPLFDPFLQTSEGARIGGTGLGLSISWQYARLMGGRLSVSSRKGWGACFRLELPLQKARGEILRKRSWRRVVGLEPGTGPWRILAVDDKPDNLSLLTSLLRPVGFEVREAADGGQALQVFEDWSPHAVLMDMRMPVMDGYEATRRIRAGRAGQQAIVIAVTAGAYEDSQKETMDAGVDAYLAKPFKAEDLFEILGRYVGVRYAFAERASEVASVYSPSHPASPSAPLRLPRAVVQNLGQAVAEGDMDRLMELIDELEQEHEQTARILRGMAENFAYERIGAWLRTAEDTHE